MTSKRKKLVTMSIAAALVTSLFVGAGSFAYLQANTGTITNKFEKNNDSDLLLTLTETGVTPDADGNGEKLYVIEQGQTAEKDPTVTVNNTVDVFTFVEISDNTTYDNTKIVLYDVDAGWKKLEGVPCINDDVTAVYYRIVEAAEQDKNYSVIQGDTIRYADTITQEKIKGSDVTLAFQAFCIEDQPFLDPAKTELDSAIDAYHALGRAFDYEPEENFTTYDGDEDNTVIISGYTGSNTEINIPPAIDGKTVVGIANRAFADNTVIQKVRIPDTVTDVAVAAFHNTPGLKSVRLSKGLVDLRGQAFYQSGLTTVTVPKGVQSITDRCFADNPDLKTVNLPVGLEQIGDHVFMNCTSLEEITLPDGLTRLGGGAFSGCTSLKTVVIPASVTDFQESEPFNFEDCNLTQLTIKGEAGSEAESYANAHNIHFEVIA